MIPTLLYECRLRRAGHALVAGVDEVGRGSWAGPVVAAAVVLPSGRRALAELSGCVRDSKQLSPAERRDAYDCILRSGSRVAVGWATHHLVDRDGLAAANRRAMCRAISRLAPPVHAVLIDYFALPECPLPQIPVTGGDARCLSIAAASIVAKVVRDGWMEKQDRRFPGYGFAQNKGYGTALHRVALAELGPSPLHRRSFGPVAALTA